MPEPQEPHTYMVTTGTVAGQTNTSDHVSIHIRFIFKPPRQQPHHERHQLVPQRHVSHSAAVLVT